MKNFAYSNADEMTTFRGYVRTCLVEVGSASCSGFIVDVDRGLVVTHATLLLPYLGNRFTTFRRLVKEGHLNGSAFEDVDDVEVTCERRATSKIEEKSQTMKAVLPPRGVYVAEVVNLVVPSSDPALAARQTVKLRGRVHTAWRSNRFAGTLRRLFPASEDWKFIEEVPPSANNKKDRTTNVSKEEAYHLLPYFILITVQFPKDRNFTTSIGRYRPAGGDFRLVVGGALYIVGTPFGNLSPSVFLNSVSKGIVSNLAGEQQELILTDARCIPGTEGGVIYGGTPGDGCLFPVGMVVAPICWKANEWIGLAVGCQLSEIFSSLKKVYRDEINPEKKSNNRSVVRVAPDECRLRVDDVPVVYVSSGGQWGSGILINQRLGVVLTCSHVVNGATEVKVRLDVPQILWLTADVVYATPNDQVFDIAILRVRNYKQRQEWPTTVNIVKDLKEGSEVFVVGHAAFGQEQKLKPSMTSGVISKVVYSSGAPVVIQTSCSVNSGASGGAVVDAGGRLVGIVACNARDKDSGATYPHINLSIPAVTIWPIIDRYMETGKKSTLSQLSLDDPHVQRLWTLQGSPARSAKEMKSRL